MTTMYPAINNSPRTELAAAITAGATSITVLYGGALPAAPNIATIGEGETAEVVVYTSITGNTLGGVTRGFGGTTTKSWPAGTVLAREYTAYDHNTFISNINDKASVASVTAVSSQITQTSRQTTELKHGLNLITSDQSSLLKVEVYGNTLVNLLGKDGNFEVDSNSDGVADGWNRMGGLGVCTLETSGANYGSKAQRIASLSTDDNRNSRRVEKTLPTIAGKYYLFAVDIATDGTSTARFEVADIVKNTTTTGLQYIKILADSTSVLIRLRNYSPIGSVGWVQFDGFRQYEIDLDTYNKIGTTFTDSDIEKLFPYVDSIQHVVNPYVKVEGENLLPINVDEWEQGSFTTAGVPTATTNRIRSKNFHTVFPNREYTISVKSGYGITVFEYTEEGNFIKQNVDATPTLTFTTSATTRKIKFRFFFSSLAVITHEEILQSELMLNFGKSKPFTPKNPSYLYAETTLAGTGSKRDVLIYNENVGKCQKVKYFENLDLHGSLAWKFSSNYTGSKRAEVPFTLAGVSRYDNHRTIKHDGRVLTNAYTTTDADYNWIDNDSGLKALRVVISNTDSGWTDAITPTNDMVKSYFNGWKYTGNGTTHSWVSIVDGSVPATNTVAYVSTNKATNYTPYKLSYQLATPITEDVIVEGDLYTSAGGTQIEVGSSFTYTTNEQGKRTYTLTSSNQRYNKTSNIAKLNATYAQNVRTALDEVVKKQSDIATEVSINSRSIIDIYVRLKALEGL